MKIKGEQFGKELFRLNLNTHELDDVPCVKCGKVPPIKKRKEKGKTVIDRTSRIDCDAGVKKEKLETYHVECWLEIAKAEIDP